MSVMEIITMESEAYQNLIASIKRIEQHVLSSSSDNPTSDEEGWIGTKEVCRLLGKSERTLQNYRSNGTINFKHCGKFCRYRLSDVKSLIAQGYGTGQGSV